MSSIASPSLNASTAASMSSNSPPDNTEHVVGHGYMKRLVERLRSSSDAPSSSTATSDVLIRGTIQNCNTHLQDSHFEYFRDSLHQHHPVVVAVKAWHVSECYKLTNRGVSALLDAIASAGVSTEQISFLSIPLNAEGLVKLAETLLSLQNLTWLSLQNVVMSEEQDDTAAIDLAWKALFQAVARHPSLHVLDLGNNKLGDSAMEALADAFLSREQQRQQRDDGPACLSKGTDASCPLAGLLLSRNRISDAGLVSLLNLLKMQPDTTPSSTSIQLKLLSLADNGRITRNGLEQLLDLLDKSYYPHLQRVYLHGNPCSTSQQLMDRLSYFLELNTVRRHIVTSEDFPAPAVPYVLERVNRNITQDAGMRASVLYGLCRELPHIWPKGRSSRSNSSNDRKEKAGEHATQLDEPEKKEESKTE